MSALLQVALVTASVTAHGGPISSEILARRNYSYAFAEFEQDFAKSYATAAARREAEAAFTANLARARAHNERTPPPSWTMTVNRFADLTPADFHRRFAGGRPRPPPQVGGASVEPAMAVAGPAQGTAQVPEPEPVPVPVPVPVLP